MLRRVTYADGRQMWWRHGRETGGIRSCPEALFRHTEICMLEEQQTVLSSKPRSASGGSTRSRPAWTVMRSGYDAAFEIGGCDGKS